jgi:hypothetical protein
LAYSIPFIALAIVAGFYVANYLPAGSFAPVENFTFQLLVQAQYPNNSMNVSAIAPKYPIGEAGGYWATTQYSSYGVDSSHYPIYMDPPSSACPAYCVVHVKSRVAFNYTLGDYFDVWGQPLGQDNTINLKSNSTSNYSWELCIGISPNSYDSSQWGNLVLVPNMNITLFYHAPSLPGCAPS